MKEAERGSTWSRNCKRYTLEPQPIILHPIGSYTTILSGHGGQGGRIGQTSPCAGASESPCMYSCKASYIYIYTRARVCVCVCVVVFRVGVLATLSSSEGFASRQSAYLDMKLAAILATEQARLGVVREHCRPALRAHDHTEIANEWKHQTSCRSQPNPCHSPASAPLHGRSYRLHTTADTTSLFHDG